MNEEGTGNIDVDLIDVLDQMEKDGHITRLKNGKIKLTPAGVKYAKELEKNGKLPKIKTKIGKNMEKLSNMKIGRAMILKKKKGVNETFDKTIKEGEYFVEVRIDEMWWQECKLTPGSQKLLKKLN